MPTILISKNRLRTFNLDSRNMIARAKRVQMTVIREARDGAQRPRRISQRIMDSLTLPANVRVSKFSDGTPLTPDIAQVPCIAKAIRKRLVKMIHVQDLPAPKKPAQKSSEEPSKSPTRSNDKK